MAKVKYANGLNPLLNEQNGFTFQPNNYGQSMFPSSRSARKRYGHQWERQHNNQKAVREWRNMSQATRNLWASFAATYPQPSKRDPNVFLSGYQLFIKRNSYCFLNHGIHSGFMLEPEFIEIQEQAVTAEIRQGEATIDCTELFIRNFGLLPKIDDWLLCKIIPIAENSGQFFAHIYQVLQVQEVFIDGLFVTLNIPDELEGVTFSVYLSKVNNQSVRYTGTKVRYMGCFTKKKFIELTDTPNSYNGQAGKIVVVNEEENAVEFIEYLPQNINVVNDYTTLINVVNNFTVFDINTQMFYTYINNEWVNITLNLNLIKVVQDYTTLVNVVNNTIVFDLTTNNFFRYDVNVWVQVGGGGGGLTCEDLLECPVIIQILEQLNKNEDDLDIVDEIIDYSGTFITEWVIPSDNFTITFPLSCSLTNDSGTIYWGDGSQLVLQSDVVNPQHTFAKSGTYKIIVAKGDIEHFSFGINSNVSKDYITKVIQWGNIQVSTWLQVFENCSNLISVSGDGCPACRDTGVDDYTNRAMFLDCVSLASIPSTLFQRSSTSWDFSNCFRNSAIESLPANLFHGTVAREFQSMCWGMTSLQNISPDLFANVVNIPSARQFYSTFYGLSYYTGALPTLWLDFDEPSRNYCFTNCTNASNYSDVPFFWK
mgnify:CR=1 FL=1